MTSRLKGLNWLCSRWTFSTAPRCSVGCVPLLLVFFGLLSGCFQEPDVPPAKTGTAHAESVPAATVRNAAIPTLIPRPTQSAAAKEGDWFLDQAQELGIQFAYHDGSTGGCYQLIESVGGGAAVLDFDRDSLQDLFFTGGGNLTRSGDEVIIQGRPAGLFRNMFTAQFQNVSRLSELNQDTSLFTHGCTVIDFDSDGFDDLIVAGYAGLRLWHNLGDGTFSEVARDLDLLSHGWNVSAAAGDLNRDGLADLYILTYAECSPDLNRLCKNDQGLRDICGPTLFPGARDQVFENTGEGLLNVTDRVGLVPKNRGLGVLMADIDANGYLDVAVVNDVEENQLYYGEAAGVFTENGVLSGVAYSNTGEREGSMGVDLGDYDHDGYPDLWYTNYTQQDNSLLRNLSDRGFVHVADAMGLSGVSRPWVGFGTGFADFNGDGWDDLFVVNGHVAYERRDSPYFQPPQLFRNDQGQRFVDASGEGGPYFRSTWSARGAAKVDWNNDGAMDLVVVQQNDPVAVLTNRHQVQYWISVDLIGIRSERSAVGAAAMIEIDGQTIKRWKYSGGSYLSHGDPKLLFTLPSADSIDVTVAWLGGAVEVFSRLKPGQTHTLLEGRGRDVDR